ncbi:hypothetical protein MLD52_17335 [Puniceicoccaceae bacterium K14]|nr:hypothetical protein [Puniceicoccaceae bacterium K14]
MQKDENPNGEVPRKNPTDRDPWPMWPIALAIGLFVCAYTFINIAHRKDGPAFEPHQAMQNRRDQLVEKNFYNWYRITTELQETVTPSGANIEKMLRPYSGALESLLPEQLVYYIPTRPVLVNGPLKIESDASIEQGAPFTIRIDLPGGIASDDRFHLQAFYKEGSLHLLPSFFVESIEDASETLATPNEQIQFAIPTDPVAATEVSIYVYAEGYIHEWKIPAFPKETPENVDSPDDAS